MAKIQTAKLTDGKQVITVNAADVKDERFKAFKVVGEKAATEAAKKAKDTGGQEPKKK